MRTFTRPTSPRLFSVRFSITSTTSRMVSPGLSALGQRSSSTPPPMMPPSIGTVSTTRRMDSAVVCQPLATHSRKKVSFAATGSMWKGCGS